MKLKYNNYFNNTNNTYDDGNNTWNITKTTGINIIGDSYIGGNYWSDYTGEDLDGDGLGDTLVPYNSSGDIATGGDYHPLMKIWTPTPTPSPTLSPSLNPTSTSTTTATPPPTSPPTPKEETPGFKIMFSITGLLAVAYLLRRRK